MAEYTLHRALTLKKTTEVRIRKAIADTEFIALRQGKKDTINGIPVKQKEQEISSNYQKIMQLISNYFVLKHAIMMSNAGVTTDTKVRCVTVGDRQYTMVELISVSDELYGNKKHQDAFYPELLRKMKSDYAEALMRVERQHDKIEQNVRDYLSKAAAGDKGMTAEEIQQRSEMFHADGDYFIVDPLDLRTIIERLDNMIKDFRADADATISEQNALNTISVELTTIS